MNHFSYLFYAFLTIIVLVVTMFFFFFLQTVRLCLGFVPKAGLSRVKEQPLTQQLVATELLSGSLITIQLPHY